MLKKTTLSEKEHKILTAALSMNSSISEVHALENLLLRYKRDSLALRRLRTSLVKTNPTSQVGGPNGIQQIGK